MPVQQQRPDHNIGKFILLIFFFFCDKCVGSIKFPADRNSKDALDRVNESMSLPKMARTDVIAKVACSPRLF